MCNIADALAANATVPPAVANLYVPLESRMHTHSAERLVACLPVQLQVCARRFVNRSEVRTGSSCKLRASARPGAPQR